MIYGPTAAPVFWGDDQAFDSIAKTLVTKHEYYNPWYPHGYPLFLAGIYLIFGQSWLTVRIIQAALGAVTCLLVYRLGKKIFTEREGVLAALVLAIYPGHIFFAWRLMAETLYMLLLVFSLVLALALAENPRLSRSVILGLALGFAQLVKPHLLLFPPMLMVWFAFTGRAPARNRILCLVAILGSFGLMLCFTPIINQMSQAGRDVAVPGSPGTVLWQGNNPVADGFDKYADGTPAGDAFIASHGFQERLKQANAFEKDRLYRDLALIWIRENPGSFMILCLKKLNNAFGPFPRARLFEHNPQARLIHLFTYGVVAFFALIGLTAATRRWRAASLLYLVVLSYVPTVLIFFGTPRFTILIIPILLVFASYGATWLSRVIFSRQPTRDSTMQGV